MTEDEPRPLSFSQRNGYTATPEAIQLEGLDDRARTDIYNAVYNRCLTRGNEPVDRRLIWTAHYGFRTDNYKPELLKHYIHETITKGEWYDVYNLLEFIARECSGDESVVSRLNEPLALNRAAYRIVGPEVVPITDATELATIREALSGPVASPARQHIEKALQLFADRAAPQYANSIKESISAAEAAARDLAGSKPTTTMGNALDEVAKQETMHRALIDGWKKLYGFTSNTGGIRHADAEGGIQPTQALAQYFLVTCSAFVNLVTALQAENES